MSVHSRNPKSYGDAEPVMSGGRPSTIRVAARPLPYWLLVQPRNAARPGGFLVPVRQIERSGRAGSEPPAMACHVSPRIGGLLIRSKSLALGALFVTDRMQA